MKLILFVCSLAIFAVGETVDTFSWDSTSYDFGEIQQNIPAIATYELTNNSNVPLLIQNVKAGCGCTSTSYSKEAIMPGETASIEAIYNAKKIGKFSKTASVTTNLSEEPTVLSFEGVVVSE